MPRRATAEGAHHVCTCRQQVGACTLPGAHSCSDPSAGPRGQTPPPPPGRCAPCRTDRLRLPLPLGRCGWRRKRPPCRTRVHWAMRADSGSEEKSRLQAAYTGCRQGGSAVVGHAATGHLPCLPLLPQVGAASCPPTPSMHASSSVTLAPCNCAQLGLPHPPPHPPVALPILGRQLALEAVHEGARRALVVAAQQEDAARQRQLPRRQQHKRLEAPGDRRRQRQCVCVCGGVGASERCGSATSERMQSSRTADSITTTEQHISTSSVATGAAASHAAAANYTAAASDAARAAAADGAGSQQRTMHRGRQNRR